MTDDKENGGKKRQRSPNYPAIGLRNAVERVGVLYKADGRPGSPLEAAVKHFGFGSAHGQAMTIVSALKKFGLVDDRDGRIVPTPLAVNIMEFGQDHQRHQEALKEAALKPSIYDSIVERYREHGRLPSDDSLRPELITDMGFNPKAVGDFLVDFRDSLQYAGLLEGNTLKLPELEPDEIGEPHPLGNSLTKFFTRDGSAPRIHDPINGNSGSAPTTDVPKAALPKRTPMQPEMKEDTFTLREGQIVLQYPGCLSPESFEDFESWLQLVIRKAKRSIRTTELEKNAEDQ